MATRTIFGILSAVVVSVGIAQADQVTLKNGDRITGAIVKKDGANLTIKSEHMGTLTVPWDQVQELKSDEPLNVVLPDKTVQSTVTTSDGKIELKEQQQSVPATDVVALRNADEQRAYERLLHPGWGELWTGTVGLGFAGTAGNASTKTFTTAMNAVRLTNSDKTTLYFNAIKSSALVSNVNADTAQAVRGGWAYSHNLSPRVFATVFNDYEYDRFQSLDLRFVIGGGLGYIAWKSDRGRLDLLGGVDYDRSKFSPGPPEPDFTRNSAEAFWGDDFSFKLTGGTSLVQSFRMFNNLSDTGTYRMNADLGLVTKISKWLTWNLGLSDRYLSNPVPGHKTNDFLYTTGIGVVFAR